MARHLVTVFGASGFIGRHLVKRLAQRGWQIRAAERDPIRAAFLKPMGEVGQINAIRADVTDPQQVRAALAGAEAVVNLVGILSESGGATFERIHHQAAAIVAREAKAAGVSRYLHMSALGADKDSPAQYARTKAAGEQAVLEAFPGATIFRPSVVFGPDDDFFNRFARMSALSPFLPVITRDGFQVVHTENGYGLDVYGSGGPVFQPVYVGDVAEAMARVADDSALAGKVYELGGPRRYAMKEIMELVLKCTGRRRLLAPIPMWAARIQASVLGLLPKPPLTRDQVALMATDNVVRGGKPGLVELGITPIAAEAVIPNYLGAHLQHPAQTVD